MKFCVKSAGLCGSLLMMVMWSCQSENTSTPVAPVDTRELVQEAYARLDIMAVPYAFNNRRLAVMKTQVDQETDPAKKLNLSIQYAYESLKCGQTNEAAAIFESVFQFLEQQKLELAPQIRRNLMSLLGVAYLRKGEIENCVQQHNHESCFLPVQGDGIHTLQEGSRKAIAVFTRLLDEFPDDDESRYLLNVAYQTIGEYPDGVPAKYLLPPAWFTNQTVIPVFRDVAPMLGVNTNALAGGTVVDDFNNDGWLDIVVTSWGAHEELVFYLNNGDGTFSDQTAAYNLKGHVGILNLTHADYNNDGWMDLLLMRGAWYGPQGDIPATLLQNTGKGGFVDATATSGLQHAAACQNAAWADYNLDGWLDVAMGNESMAGYPRGINLYINNGDGTFTDQATAWGLTANAFIKGSVATDVNNDGYPDLYFSTIDTLNLLYLNKGKEGPGFTSATSVQHGGLPVSSFPCWSFDFDNNGHEDLFTSAFNNDGTPSTLWVKSHTGEVEPGMLPKLYQNMGGMQFREVAAPMGITEVAFTMGCNFGDINLDGYLDFYLGTGNPAYQSLVPNKMYLNLEGRAFADVSYVGGFANAQKGHGVGFGDLDRDGDEDIYINIGGSFDGDAFFNCLFENPNFENNNWLVLKLTGTRANRCAMGARVRISITEDGAERILHRTITGGSSFGGNSLALELGLRKATAVNSVTVQWPCLDCATETYSGMSINKAYQLVQGAGRAEEIPYTAAPFQASGDGDGHMHH